jgi:hypothetical protein
VETKPANKNEYHKLELSGADLLKSGEMQRHPQIYFLFYKYIYFNIVAILKIVYIPFASIIYHVAHGSPMVGINFSIHSKLVYGLNTLEPPRCLTRDFESRVSTISPPS